MEGRSPKTRIRELGAWVAFVERPMFSVLGSVYNYVDSTQREITPSTTAIEELNLLLDLAPLVRAQLTLQYTRLTICTDASLRGGGCRVHT